MREQSVDKIAIRHFWRLCAQHKRLFAFTWLIPLANIGIGVVVPYLIGKILGSLAVPGSKVMPYIVTLVIVSITRITH